MENQKKQVSVSQVLALLADGKDRVAIKAELGLSVAEMSLLFQHPKLKNQKPKRPVSFELVDDTIEEVEGLEENKSVVETPVSEVVNEVASEPVTEIPAEVKEGGVW